MKPAGQGKHGPASPGLGMNVPAGHCWGIDEPAGQTLPGLHNPPPTLLCKVKLYDRAIGLGEWLPAAQKYPRAHLPDGAVSPAASQYEPGKQREHSEALRRPTELENVPMGQGMGVSVPMGQNDPAGHGLVDALLCNAVWPCEASAPNEHQ